MRVSPALVVIVYETHCGRTMAAMIMDVAGGLLVDKNFGFHEVCDRGDDVIVNEAVEDR